MSADTPSTPWLRHLLRYALIATPSTPPPWNTTEYGGRRIWETGGGELVDPDDPGKDPRFRKLVEAILFSRRFLNTYNLVLVGVLLVFTMWHWGEKVVLELRKKRRHRAHSRDNTRGSPEEEVWSSSSSTIEGSATPPNAARKLRAVDERSALLSSGLPSKQATRSLWKSYYMLKATMQYQPSRIPVLNKPLPTNAVSLLVLSWIGLTIFYNFYRMPLSFMYLFVFADRCGLIFVVNLPVLYLLAAKNQPIRFLTGYSYESLNIFHRRVGEAMCLEAFLHFLGMVATWYGLLRHLGFTLARFLFNRVVLLGLAAFIAYEVIYFTSLSSFRQRYYEIFLALHIALQVAGLVFLWFHHHTSRPYVGISLTIFLIDRLVYRLWLRSSTHQATLTILEDDETLLLSTNWDVMQTTSLAPQNMHRGWKPNEHVFITVPELSRKHMFQSHPFTIFSAAPVATTPTATTAVTTGDDPNTHAWFTLLIRAQSPSGFTHHLLEHARTHSQTRICLDGPYGSPHALTMLEASSTAILIAGGSGIAVAYPLLYALLHPHTTPLSTNTPTPPDTESAIPHLSTKHPSVKLLWITHAPTHRLWIPDAKLKELEDWGLDILICPPTSLAGRPDVCGILGEWVSEHSRKGGRRRGNRSTQSESSAGSSHVGVVVSGPDGLVRDVRNTVACELWKGRNLSLQVEKFGW